MTLHHETIELLKIGPQAHKSQQRWKFVQVFTDRLKALYADQIVAIALYGSMARDEDRPYSDIEMFCIVDVPDMDTTFEWVYGSGKAEINILGRNDARWEAREVGERWAISQGAFLNARLIYGDASSLQELKDLVMAVTDDEIGKTIGLAMVGELYEWIGKSRNALTKNDFSGIVLLACKFTEMVALLLGLANRTCYKTGSRLLDDSLDFADLPDSYAELCNLVMRGDLSNPKVTIAAMEATWAGMVSWAASRNVEIAVALWPFRQGNALK